ncbi:MAG: FecR domain-containing protein [Chitinophagaceae bacterium]
MEQHAGKSFDELLDAYINDQLSAEDTTALNSFLQNEEYQDRLKSFITQKLHEASFSGEADGRRGDILFNNIVAANASRMNDSNQNIVSIKKTSFYRSKKLIAAAFILAFVGAGIYFLMNRPQTPAPVLAAHKKGEYKNDVLPGRQKATLTLGNGTVIDLDSAQNGALAQQGSSHIIKLNGKIDYQQAQKGSADVLFNTIATPKGGQYQVMLPDGSMVWLNAASSIYFPTAFIGSERRVKISGEAYFEVAKDKSKPFIVESGSSEVKVLGTHFNVMAYNDEERMETTLLEGAVAFSNNNRTLMLQPGEQSKLMKDGRLEKANNADADEILAWKNGMFHFENADIYAVMRQLSRWYDVNVEYRATPGKEGYFLEMPRASKLSSILKVLELTSNIHLEIEGNKIIIS